MSEIDGDEILSQAATVRGLDHKLAGKRRSGSAARSNSMILGHSKLFCPIAHADAAVERCCNLRNHLLADVAEPEDRIEWDEDFLRLYEVYEQAIQEAKSFEKATIAAQAYLAAIPDPVNRRAVNSYIACVLHAMSIGILDHGEGAKLLSGARLASLALLRRTRNKQKDQASEAPRIEPATQAPDSEIATQKCA